METITFILPSNDVELVDQVYEHINQNSETVDVSHTLLAMAKKYRFAGYIGILDYLFIEIQNLKNELQKTKDELKNKKRPWLF
jgi:hypothetical protein